MLDIQLLRKDLDSVVARLQTRKNPQAFLNVEAFKALESERKSIQTRTEELQSKRNQLSKQIGMLMGKGEKDAAEAAKAEVAAMKSELEQSATRLDQIQSELQTMLAAVPNLPHESVPVGADEAANVVVRTWGTPRNFDFQIKDHVDLGAPIGLDFESGIKLTGARFTVMQGQIARLRLHCTRDQFVRLRQRFINHMNRIWRESGIGDLFNSAKCYSVSQPLSLQSLQRFQAPDHHQRCTIKFIFA